MNSVVSISQIDSKAGVIFELHLDCGHVNKVTPLDDPRDYERAPFQKRAKCTACNTNDSGFEKKCSDCLCTKSIDEFYRARGCSDGRQKRCKECQKVYIKSLGKKSGACHTSDASARYRERNKTKYLARAAVANAVARGEMIKPLSCEECGIKTLVHGHHDDYSQPLFVRWLCQGCHSDWHRLYGEAKN